MDSLKNENHLGVILAYPDSRQEETAPKCQAVLSQSEGDIDFMSCVLDYVKDKGLDVANVTKLHPVLTDSSPSLPALASYVVALAALSLISRIINRWDLHWYVPICSVLKLLPAY